MLRAGFHRAKLPLLAALVVLTSLAARATWEQVCAHDRAVALHKAGDVDAAIAEYRWALRWYTPWGPAWSDAAAALWTIGAQASAAEPERAMAALDALRSGLIAGRHLWQPRADLVAEVNRTLPAVLVRVAARAGDKRDPKTLLQRFTADYARPVGVAPLTSAAVSLGFLTWLLGLLMVARRGVDANARITGTGWRWLGVAAAGFTIWTAAMWLG